MGNIIKPAILEVKQVLQFLLSTQLYIIFKKFIKLNEIYDVYFRIIYLFMDEGIFINLTSKFLVMVSSPMINS